MRTARTAAPVTSKFTPHPLFRRDSLFDAAPFRLFTPKPSNLRPFMLNLNASVAASRVSAHVAG